MYFVVASLSEIDPMYQYSLKYFKNVSMGFMKNENSSCIILLKKLSPNVMTEILFEILKVSMKSACAVNMRLEIISSSYHWSGTS